MRIGKRDFEARIKGDLQLEFGDERLTSHAGLELVRRLLDPLPGAEVVIAEGARAAMADAIHLVFIIAFVAAALAMVTVFFTPRKELTDQQPERERSPVSAD